MPKPTLRYDRMVETALRGVVREALAVAAQRGLPGSHHFYISFRTDHPGVDMPDFLKAQYPMDMTIVLQHQFWGLEVDDTRFAVTLSFHSQAQRLSVPLAALTAFEDPAVRFRLEFRPDMESPPAAAALPPSAAGKAPSPPGEAAGGVVRLDAFRKKQS